MDSLKKDKHKTSNLISSLSTGYLCCSITRGIVYTFPNALKMSLCLARSCHAMQLCTNNSSHSSHQIISCRIASAILPVLLVPPALALPPVSSRGSYQIIHVEHIHPFPDENVPNMISQTSWPGRKIPVPNLQSLSMSSPDLLADQFKLLRG